MNVNELAGDRREGLLAVAHRRTYLRGAAIYRPGDPADRLCIVESGRVKIVRTHASGNDMIVGFRVAGDVFGELSALEAGARRTSSAIAIEPTVVAGVPAAEMAALLSADPDLAYTFARGIARRLALAERELAEMAGKSVSGRLVDTLGRLASSYGIEDADGTVRIELNLTHRDLADLIGTSRETLTRELGVLADVGLVRITPRSVTLIQPRAFPYVGRRE
jgi:CRP/FNR family transcriptional regulator, cyclic AMP receptor protein